jgi:hypothetical protein
MQHVQKGEGVPDFAPTSFGQHYVDVVNLDHYISMGTRSPSDWIKQIQGSDGASAYQLAVEAGYTGTLSEWLDTLKGPQGEPGTPGPAGEDGQSPELRVNEGWLETRVNDGAWTQLIELSTLGPDNVVVSPDGSVVSIVALTQAEYDALDAPDPQTFYHITDSTGGTNQAVITDPVVTSNELDSSDNVLIDRSRGHIFVVTPTRTSVINFALSEGEAVTVHIKGGDQHIVAWNQVNWVGILQAPSLNAHNVLEFWKAEGMIYGGHAGLVTNAE